MKTRRMIMGITAAAALLWAPGASADKPVAARAPARGSMAEAARTDQGKPLPPCGSARAKVVVDARGKRTILLEPCEIVGDPQRPSAFYLIERTRRQYAPEDAARHLTSRIVESVTREPF